MLTGELGVPGNQKSPEWLRATSLYHTWKEGTVRSVHNGVVAY